MQKIRLIKYDETIKGQRQPSPLINNVEDANKIYGSRLLKSDDKLLLFNKFHLKYGKKYKLRKSECQYQKQSNIDIIMAVDFMSYYYFANKVLQIKAKIQVFLYSE